MDNHLVNLEKIEEFIVFMNENNYEDNIIYDAMLCYLGHINLDISNLKYINNNTFNYTHNNTLEQGTDILIVSLFNQHTGDYTRDNKLKTDNTQPSIIDLSIMGTNKTITYQGIEYVLDYNILTSSKLINIINNEHLIAGIYIDNEKYLCDSEDYLLNRLDIKTTCGFNRFDWNSDLLNCTNEICYNHLCEIISTTNNTVFKVKNIPHGIRFCYNNNMNRYVFIRKDLYDELKGLMVP